MKLQQVALFDLFRGKQLSLPELSKALKRECDHPLTQSELKFVFGVIDTDNSKTVSSEEMRLFIGVDGREPIVSKEKPAGSVPKMAHVALTSLLCNRSVSIMVPGISW